MIWLVKKKHTTGGIARYKDDILILGINWCYETKNCARQLSNDSYGSQQRTAKGFSFLSVWMEMAATVKRPGSATGGSCASHRVHRSIGFVWSPDTAETSPEVLLLPLLMWFCAGKGVHPSANISREIEVTFAREVDAIVCCHFCESLNACGCVGCAVECSDRAGIQHLEIFYTVCNKFFYQNVSQLDEIS